MAPAGFPRAVLRPGVCYCAGSAVGAVCERPPRPCQSFLAGLSGGYAGCIRAISILPFRTTPHGLCWPGWTEYHHLFGTIQPVDRRPFRHPFERLPERARVLCDFGWVGAAGHATGSPALDWMGDGGIWAVRRLGGSLRPLPLCRGRSGWNGG